MNELKIPSGHHRLNPYFMVPDHKAFITLLTKVFGAKEKELHVNEDGRLMHAEFTIGDTALMFGESSEQ